MVNCKVAALATTLCVSIAVGALRVSVREARAAIQQLNQVPNTHSVTYMRGPLGMRINSLTGEVVAVYEGQSRDAGVMVGMMICKIDGVNYTRELLVEKQNGDQEYTVVFDRNKEQILIDEPLGVAACNPQCFVEQQILDELLASISHHKEHDLASKTTDDAHFSEPSSHKTVTSDLPELSSPEQAPLPSLLAPSRTLRKRKAVESPGPQDAQMSRGGWADDTGSEDGQMLQDRIGKPSRRQQWTVEDDEKLRRLTAGDSEAKLSGNWHLIATHFQGRSRSSVWEHWRRHLNPNLKKCEWTPEEDQQILKSMMELGKQWRQISRQYLPNRADIDIKNRWRVLAANIPEQTSLAPPRRQAERRTWSAEEDAQLKHLVSEHGSEAWAKIATLLGDRSKQQCIERWRRHLRPDLAKHEWTPEEDQEILKRVMEVGKKWGEISTQYMPNRADNHIKNRWKTLTASRRPARGAK